MQTAPQRFYISQRQIVAKAQKENIFHSLSRTKCWVHIRPIDEEI